MRHVWLGVQVLANLTVQNSNSYQGGPQSHMSQQTHMTHYQAHPGAPQMQVRPQFSQPQMVAQPQMMSQPQMVAQPQMMSQPQMVAGAPARPMQVHSPHRVMPSQQAQPMQPAQQQMVSQQMASQQMQAQQQAQQMQLQAQQMQAQQRQAAMRGGPQAVQAATRPYTVHNVSPLDDPLMTTMH